MDVDVLDRLTSIYTKELCLGPSAQPLGPGMTRRSARERAGEKRDDQYGGGGARQREGRKTASFGARTGVVVAARAKGGAGQRECSCTGCGASRQTATSSLRSERQSSGVRQACCA